MNEYHCGLFDRINFDGAGNPCKGDVRWSPAKSLWWTGMLVGWLVLGTIYFSWLAVGAFLVTTAVTLCLGHSLGMHRKLIHESFDSPPWVEKVMVYLGTLVGLGGPFTMMHTHDMRDWAQRQPDCHDFLSHQRRILTDFWWQLHCRLHLREPPEYKYPLKLTGSRYYRFIEHTWMLQQLPLAIVLFMLGGWGFVAWGICARVTVSIFGHWVIGYFAHNQGHRDWHIHGAAVQGYNIRHFGLITFGECWHNNHHAFPGSARLGLLKGQFDPGWLVLKALRKIGLVHGLRQPDDLPDRSELCRLPEQIGAANPNTMETRISQN